MNALPDTIKKGHHIHQIVPRNSHPGIIELARTGIQVGSAGSATCRRVTSRGARLWHHVKNRLRIMIPQIAHWEFIHGDYKDLSNRHATWFIDPPYNNDAGRAYATNAIDYSHLADWCKSRRGQVIACENVGATWLPFRELDTKMSGVHADYQPAKEAIWTNEFETHTQQLDISSGHSI